MIWSFILPAVSGFFGAIFALLPTVTELPLGLDTILTTAVGYLYAFSQVFWPFTPVLTCLFLYYPIKLALMGLRVLIGSRSPDAS